LALIRSFFLAGNKVAAHGVKYNLEHASKVSIGKDCMLSDEALIQCGNQFTVILLVKLAS
jgi:hypothetical protein